MESIQDRLCYEPNIVNKNSSILALFLGWMMLPSWNQNNGQTVVDQVMIVFSTFQVAMDMDDLLEIPLILAL